MTLSMTSFLHGFQLGGDCNPLHLHKPTTPHKNQCGERNVEGGVITRHAHLDAVADFQMSVGNGRNTQAARLDLRHNGFGDGMRLFAFRRRRKAQEQFFTDRMAAVLTTAILTKVNPADMRLFQRQRPGFVKDDRVHIFQHFKRARVFNQQTVPGSNIQIAEHGKRPTKTGDAAGAHRHDCRCTFCTQGQPGGAAQGQHG